MNRRILSVAIVIAMGTITVGGVFLSYFVPATFMKFGREEAAAAKFLFRIDARETSAVEASLRDFSKQNGLSFNLIHLPGRGPAAIDLRMANETIGEITVNNGVRENEYNCYFYRRGALADPGKLLNDFKSRFLNLEAEIIEERIG